MAKYTAAQNRASQKYQKNNYERIALSLPKGNKEKMKAAADAAGESLTEYIRKAVQMRMQSEADAKESIMAAE